MKDRKKIKGLRNKIRYEYTDADMLDSRDICGIRDPTPKEAISNLILENRLSSKRRKDKKVEFA